MENATGALKLVLTWIVKMSCHTPPLVSVFFRRFGNLQLTSSVIADEGNWRLPKRLERSFSFVG